MLLVTGFAATSLSDELRTAAPAASIGRPIVLQLVLLSLAAGVVWALAAPLTVRANQAVARLPRRPIAIAAAALAAVAVALAAAPVAATVERQWDSFVNLQADFDAEASAPRLISGTGFRYDYWRVAWEAFTDKPVAGVGAGNYAVPYYQLRRTGEDVRQPHSMFLQALAELGAVGALLLLAFVGAVGVAVVRRRRDGSDAERLATGAAITMAVVWLAHASVDWLHLLPGVVAVALLSAAILVRPVGEVAPTAEPRPRRPVLRIVSVVAILFGVTVAGLTLSRQLLSEHFRGEAQAALDADNPVDALEQANRALRLAPESNTTRIVKAAALARLGEGRLAEGVLEEAVRREPRNFLPRVLLGDLAVRQGNMDEAKALYGSALRLNPRDLQLRRLAQRPAAALEGQ
jgi:tetratricopeptide (TPR) repeat protein